MTTRVTVSDTAGMRDPAEYLAQAEAIAKMQRAVSKDKAVVVVREVGSFIKTIIEVEEEQREGH